MQLTPTYKYTLRDEIGTNGRGNLKYNGSISNQPRLRNETEKNTLAET